MALDPLKLFTSLGLTSTEAKVYIANLKLGPTSVQEIAKKAKLSRTATYDAVASLQEHGLITTFDRGKKKYFVAEEPERAIAHFRQEISQLEENLNSLTRALPEIKLLSGGEKPVVRFYEGDEAIFAVFTDAQKVQPKEVMEVSNMSDVYEHIRGDLLEMARKTFNPKVSNIRVLHSGNLVNPKNGVQFCKLIDGLPDFHGDILIYENRVVFMSYIGKSVAVIIESKTLVDTAKVLYEAAWQICSNATK